MGFSRKGGCGQHGCSRKGYCQQFAVEVTPTSIPMVEDMELRPNETTIVSWKKLLKDAASNKINGNGPLVSGPSSEPHHTIPDPAPAPPLGASSLKQSNENVAKDLQAQPTSNHLSNVIERIKRLYAVRSE
ncbi:unnamed protein product [Fraxinus pennsylvanica]|uniref:Uncharacterized protein n=1 Tax=Fraxinus pennsylvanica TaxID=56036 RepID=A0AAD2AFT8_9LAMI|nr:unnamed protein product [Fraxinus pennsylvanica]